MTHLEQALLTDDYVLLQTPLLQGRYLFLVLPKQLTPLELETARAHIDLHFCHMKEEGTLNDLRNLPKMLPNTAVQTNSAVAASD